jgi:hypothetical protein
MLSSTVSTSCFVVTDLGRFEKAEPRPPSNFSDLRVSMTSLNSHTSEMFEYRVVDSSNVIQSRGFIIPLGSQDFDFFVPNAVPKQNGPFRLDFYADHDNSGGYFEPRRDGTHVDHSWRLPLEPTMLDENDTYVVTFAHNQSWVYLDDPAPPIEFGKTCKVHLRAMEGFLKKRVEVRVSDATTRRVVAMYRVPSLTKPELDAVVPGMIESGVTYAVEVYTDDGKGGAVQAFRLEQVATDVGLEANFSGTSPGVRVDKPSPP